MTTCWLATWKLWLLHTIATSLDKTTFVLVRPLFCCYECETFSLHPPSVWLRSLSCMNSIGPTLHLPTHLDFSLWSCCNPLWKATPMQLPWLKGGFYLKYSPQHSLEKWVACTRLLLLLWLLLLLLLLFVVVWCCCCFISLGTSTILSIDS